MSYQFNQKLEYILNINILVKSIHMEKLNSLLENCLSEQVIQEESLYKAIENQVLEVDEKEFPEAKKLLISINDVLEEHYISLNQMLYKIDSESQVGINAGQVHNSEHHDGHDGHNGIHGRQSKPISRILRDVYSMLNSVTMSYAQLHTTGLALEKPDIAKLALDHLARLTSLITKIGEIVPNVVIRELLIKSFGVNPIISDIAFKNIKPILTS